MKFDVIIGGARERKFKKIIYPNSRPCIEGTVEGEDTDLKISVIPQIKEQVETYPSINKNQVLYPVRVGDCIIVLERKNGVLHANYYKVISITDTEVIGGPVD